MAASPVTPFVKGARDLSASSLAWRKADVVKCKLWNFKVLFRVVVLLAYNRIRYGYNFRFMLSEFFLVSIRKNTIPSYISMTKKMSNRREQTEDLIP